MISSDLNVPWFFAFSESVLLSVLDFFGSQSSASVELDLSLSGFCFRFNHRWSKDVILVAAMVKACYTQAVPNEKESTFLTFNDGARLFFVRLVTGTRGHSANALDGIQTRAMGWTVGVFCFFFFFWTMVPRISLLVTQCERQRQPDGRRARWNPREWTHLQVVILEGEAHARNTILESEIAF